MSSTEAFKGIAKKVAIPDHLSLNEKIKHFHENISELSNFDQYKEDCLEECFREHFWKQPEKYLIVGGDIYGILEIRDICPESIFEGSRNSDDSINFVVSYYNGGMGFEEALQEVMNKV